MDCSMWCLCGDRESRPPAGKQPLQASHTALSSFAQASILRRSFCLLLHDDTIFNADVQNAGSARELLIDIPVYGGYAISGMSTFVLSASPPWVLFVLIALDLHLSIEIYFIWPLKHQFYRHFGSQ
jgi:hypothetical protein